MFLARPLFVLAVLSPLCIADTDPAVLSQIRAMQDQIVKLQSRVEQLESVVRPVPIPTPPTRVLADEAHAAAPAKSSPVVFNGEFRLYVDSLTRPPSADAPRVQNIRGRYQLQLAFHADLFPTLSFHGRLASGQVNNPLTDIQDFGGGPGKHPISIADAYIDYHPNKYVTLQGGRLDNPFNDRSRFLFDIDTRFNGTNEFFRVPFSNKPLGIAGIQFIAGQYTFTNPNFAVIAPGTPSTAATATPSQAFLAAGAEPNSIPRASQLFQQGFNLDQSFSDSLSQHTLFDVQAYRNPNQLRLLSTPAGTFLVGNTTGLTIAGVLPSPGNATTTPGGATLTAPSFRIGHVSYVLEHKQVSIGRWNVPMSLNVQFARNLGPIQSDRNAYAAIATAGRASKPGDVRFQYGYYRKEANSMLAELTEYDIAIGSNVNMNANLLRIEYTFARNVVFANNFIRNTWISGSDPARRFFVPFGPSVPSQFRYQGILMFRF